MLCFEFYIITIKFILIALHSIVGAKICFFSGNNTLLLLTKQLLVPAITCNALIANLKLMITYNSKQSMYHPVFI